MSIFQGRPQPQEGESLWTQEDRDWIIALAEEERATCPSCGLLKSVCRDPDYQLAFEPHEEQCNATWRLAQFRQSDGWKNKHPATQEATQVSVRFRDGQTPPLDIGLDLSDGPSDRDDDSEDQQSDEESH